MVFSDLLFIYVFLCATLILYFLFKNIAWKNAVLIAASLFFYAWGEPFYIFLLLLSSLVNYVAGLLIENHRAHGKAIVAAALVFEAFVLLAETPLYGLWTGIITALIILYNFSGVWAMARILLPKILGRRGKALVAVVDGWMTKK